MTPRCAREAQRPASLVQPPAARSAAGADRGPSRAAQLIGVSIDSVFSHLAWVNTPRNQGGLGGISFPLVADVTKSIAKDYGVLIEDGDDAGIALRCAARSTAPAKGPAKGRGGADAEPRRPAHAMRVAWAPLPRAAAAARLVASPWLVRAERLRGIAAAAACSSSTRRVCCARSP